MVVVEETEVDVVVVIIVILLVAYLAAISLAVVAAEVVTQYRFYLLHNTYLPTHLAPC